MAEVTTSEPGDFMAGLLQDHARIEERLKSLDAAAAALTTVESDAAALEAVVDSLRFFSVEGARHEAHEELTLFPALRPLPEFAQILSALEFQHRMNDTAAKELQAWVKNYSPGGGRELRRLAYRFAEMHRGHAIAEERALFPLAATRLSPKRLLEMSREMRQRNAARGSPGEERR